MSAKATLRRAVTATLRAGFLMAGSRGRRILSTVLADAAAGTNAGLRPEMVEVIPTSRGPVKFYCLGDLPLWRARTLLSKEPETIEWIDSFGSGEMLWDIGANVGVYTLYAGIDRRTRVMAFEPSAANYVLLNRNIEINGLSDTVKAYCMAFAKETEVGDLFMTDTAFGGAINSFGEPVDHEGKTFEAHFRQGMISFSVDGFIAAFAPPFPDHIKIDVDGIEDRIVKGALKTLADPRLKSLSIELDANRPEYTGAVLADIEAAGLVLKSKRHAAMFDDSPYAGIFNYLFIRG